MSDGEGDGSGYPGRSGGLPTDANSGMLEGMILVPISVLYSPKSGVSNAGKRRKEEWFDTEYLRRVSDRGRIMGRLG